MAKVQNTTKVTKEAKAVAKAAKPAKTEKVAKEKAPVVGKYGAPAQRVNRTTHDKSEFGNRKWIYRGVTEANLKTSEFTATDPKECKAFPKETAEKILAKAMSQKDVVNGRLFFKKAGEDGTEMRSVWIALVSDNGDHRVQKNA